jgi:hypothetical protein
MAARASLEEVDETLILTHETSKSAKGAGGRSRKEIVADLKLAPMVMEGLGHLRSRRGAKDRADGDLSRYRPPLGS